MLYTLRDLPLPVKVVASVFLMAVGVGYSSAMLQLHMQDAKTGKPMPTVDDVVLKYTGKKWFDGPPPPPVSTLEALVMGPVEGAPWNGTGSMAPAFFHMEVTYKRQVEANPADKPRLDAERNGERELVRWWINAPAADRRKMYDADNCDIAPAKAPKQITDKFKNANGGFKIKSLLDSRCARCHSAGGAQSGYPLETYEQFEKYMTVPPVVDVPQGGGWAKVGTPIGLEKLTQSTHAHLLSFAMLFSLTGVIFAFSSWPVWIRVVIGPSVVLAVFADVSLWWLARLCDQWGPYFAQGIIATGLVAGIGLCAQIGLSLFNMYEWKGKAVIALLVVLGAAGGIGFVKLLTPALPKRQPAPVQNDIKPNGNGNQPNGNGKGVTDDVKALAGAVADAMNKKPAVVVLRKPIHALDKLLVWPPVDLDGKPVPLPEDPKQFPFNGEGSMVPAFFEKDKEYKKFVESTAAQEEKDKLKAHRQGDLDAMLAWVRTAESARKTAYEADKFDLPGLSDRVITADFVKDGKVKIKSLIDARCVTCHGAGKKQEDYPLDTYEGLSQYLKPLEAPAPAPKGDGNVGAAPVVPPAPPVPAKPVEPIPDAKDD